METIAFWRNVLKLTRPYRGRLILGIICGFVAGMSNALLMVSVKLVIDTVFPQKDTVSIAEHLHKFHGHIRDFIDYLFPSLITRLAALDVQSSKVLALSIIALVPLSMFLRGLLGYLNIYLMNWVCFRAINDLRARLFSHLLGLSSSFFSGTSTGTLMAHLNSITALQSMIGNSLVTIIQAPVSIIFLVGVLINSQPKLSLIALIIFPVTLLPFVIYSRKVRGSTNAMQQQYTEQSKLIHESFTGYRIIKAFNLEENAEQEFVKTSRASLSHQMRTLRSAEIPGPLIEFFGALGVAGFFIYMFFSPQKTPGDLIQFVGSVFMLYAPIKALLRLHSQLEQARAATDACFKLLATRSVIAEPAQPKPLQAAGKDIQFDNLTFSYGQKTVLHEINLTVKAGQIVALVGSSGAGKTTLTNLLLRFYDPQQGAVRIGGLDIREVASRDLRSQIAVVTQETILFNDTIRRNIEMGRPGAGEPEIIAAAKHAHAHEFILEKPSGYQTIIGERGVSISGGQRQRLAIARAIVKNAPILILDEATSSLDNESERAVQAALEELMEGRTTICIAHRLSTIQRADVIVVLDQGRIVEIGRHQELLAHNGKYRRLYELEFQG